MAPSTPNHRLVSLVLALATVLLLPPITTSAQQPPTVTLTWRPCGSFECATLSVPLNYDDPADSQVDLALIRQPAEEPTRRIGSLVINPGGPGGSGINFLRGWARGAPQVIQDRFDIVSFDPRGVGLSDPLICGDNLEAISALDPTPDTDSEQDALEDAYRGFTALCTSRGGGLLPHLGTNNVVRDLDRIRWALGEDKLSYLGYSYGTVIGALYADAFPQRVRAMVLDGAVDLSLPVFELGIQQSRGFEGALSHFLADCAARACLDDPSTDVDTLLDRVEQQPIPSATANRPAGPGETVLAIFTALYSDGSWPELGRAVDRALNGDGSGLVRLADSFLTDGNLMEMYIAVSCVDYDFPRDHAAFEQAGLDAATAAPHFGEANILNWLPCATWPAPPSPLKTPVATGAPPIVVIGTTGDPATPYAWAVTTSEQLESAVLLTYNGEGHTVYGGSDACIDAAVNTYLVDLTAPAANTTCGDPTRSTPIQVTDAPVFTPGAQPEAPGPSSPDPDGTTTVQPAVIGGLAVLILGSIGLIGFVRSRRR